MTVLFTVGHGAGSAASLLERCARNGVVRIVDVRTAPGSRRHPHFARAQLATWLPAGGVSYRWEPALGGFRRARGDSPNTGLRNASFRGYADHMSSAEFHEALVCVIEEADAQPTAVMCSETLWWRCHRRLIADAAVLLHGADVLHIDGAAGTAPHVLTDTARRADGDVLYAADELEMG